jgi:cell division septation protein DedD
MRTLLLALTIGFASLPASAQTVRAGIDAWQKGDAAAAVGIWRPLAERGDADAAFNLGQAYRLGKGVPLDLAQAQSWLERAARKGHVDAAATLGLLLFQNGNRVSGMRWLKGAAQAGEPRALLMVGTAMYNGDEIPRDPVTAYAYVSRAAAQGLAPAKATLADMDQVMPLEQRQKGLALAQAMAGGKKPAPKPAVQKSSPAPKQAEVAKPVAAKPRAATPVAAATGSWRIQLGAFGQKSSAQALFGTLSERLGGRQAYYVPVGGMTRLQVGPYPSKAAADAACASLRPQPCFAVLAK